MQPTQELRDILTLFQAQQRNVSQIVSSFYESNLLDPQQKDSILQAIAETEKSYSEEAQRVSQDKIKTKIKLNLLKLLTGLDVQQVQEGRFSIENVN